MRQVRKQRVFACDFETTVYEGQEYTEVWSSAFAELFTEDVTVHHSISDTFEYFSRMDGNILLYYHNLKFDGAFWLDYLQQSCIINRRTTESKDLQDIRLNGKILNICSIMSTST